ncbi:MAG TPA: hypothetical protein VGV18_12300, partial [Verrucomicrobiae bacterium]|nr:hypothetical protein [Verrucomicrobiae bacterium]
MFNALQLKEMVNAKPFRPFRIKMSDGSTRDVPNHDGAWVTRSTIEVGLDLDKNKIPGRVTRCAILHFMNIEDLHPA